MGLVKIFSKKELKGRKKESKRFLGFILDRRFLTFLDKVKDTTGFNRLESIRMALMEKLEGLGLVSNVIKNDLKGGQR
ncbi:hypothetical protein AKJ65_01560 [candidate division MSBL1 archaeon SCGC-AAA259E19]|uniref:Uncharacterized protein n=1 Tax=candidate division MSBL1 archaeon SCGC-AAA259E19 TaxID=1698264 RepID=A0A133UN00_9EURY|nr:hypothetical protein AKJ65_01560 [candidate division MSBL1 archaeon SCGC-AAA259E19]